MLDVEFQIIPCPGLVGVVEHLVADEVEVAVVDGFAVGGEVVRELVVHALDEGAHVEGEGAVGVEEEGEEERGGFEDG